MEQIFRQWIGMHRAMIAWYHAAHHVTKGTGFGGDHVSIYGEIYTQLDEDLDGIVEKGIGLTGDETLADPVSSLSLAATKLAQYPSAANQSADMIACSAFEISKVYVQFLEQTYQQFEASGSMSLGLDDLLQSLANQYETYVYLLQQRSRGTGMKITESQLRKRIRKAIVESKSFPWYENKQPENPYTHGYGGYGGSHDTLFDNIRDHNNDDPGVIDLIIDWTHEVESLYKDAYDEEEERLDFEEGLRYGSSEYKKAMRSWMESKSEDWMSRYSESGASEVIPERVWGMLFDYIIADYMSPEEFLDKINSSRW